MMMMSGGRIGAAADENLCHETREKSVSTSRFVHCALWFIGWDVSINDVLFVLVSVVVVAVVRDVDLAILLVLFAGDEASLWSHRNANDWKIKELVQSFGTFDWFELLFGA